MEIKSKHKLVYLQCKKAGYHYGQPLNTVCLQPPCLQNSICCTACVQQNHKKHTTKPLKIILKQAYQASQKIQPIQLNTQSLIEMVKTHQKTVMESFINSKKKINQFFQSIEKTLAKYYGGLLQQIRVKTNKSKGDIEKIFQEFYNNSNIDVLTASVQKILSLIPKSQTPQQPIKQKDLTESVQTFNQQIADLIQKFSQTNINAGQNTLNQLIKVITQGDVWSKPIYKFSTKFKHNQITILSNNIAKSGPNSSYKFVIIQPDLQKTKANKRFAFKIKQLSNNWLALGVCHKNIVATKGYSFVYNTVGHGGYMISSNGGSWSNIKPQFNNTVKAFKFAKNDIIFIQVNFQKKKLKFKKKGTAENYELDFNLINGDPLFVCVLFYYGNDEAQYLPQMKVDWPN